MNDSDPTIQAVRYAPSHFSVLPYFQILGLALFSENSLLVYPSPCSIPAAFDLKCCKTLWTTPGVILYTHYYHHHSFNQYLLSNFDVPDGLLGGRNTANKIDKTITLIL